MDHNAEEATPPRTQWEENRSDHALRCPFFCEENAFRVLRSKLDKQRSFYVVYISNPSKTVVMKHQRASRDVTICWDYHVILISSEALVYDVDTELLPYPMPLADYLDRSFPIISDDFSCFRPCFRVRRGNHCLDYFGSNRRHMFNESTQTWNATPPSYDCIASRKLPFLNTHTYYMNFQAEAPAELPPEAQGVILSLAQLRSFDFCNGEV